MSEQLVKSFIVAQRKAAEQGYAYRMGFDCAINGANMTNCHFAIFSTPEQTKEWERGKRDGDAAKDVSA